MKIQLVRLLDNDNSKYAIIRSYNHSEEVIIQRNRVKIIDLNSCRVLLMYVLEGLGQLSWQYIKTTGNSEIFSQILVGPEIKIGDVESISQQSDEKIEPKEER